MNKTTVVKQRLRRIHKLAILLVLTVLLSVFGAGTLWAAPSDFIVVNLDTTFNNGPSNIEGYTYMGWKLNDGDLQTGTPSYMPVRGNTEDVTITYVYKKNPAPAPTPVSPKAGE